MESFFWGRGGVKYCHVWNRWKEKEETRTDKGNGRCISNLWDWEILIFDLIHLKSPEKSWIYSCVTVTITSKEWMTFFSKEIDWNDRFMIIIGTHWENESLSKNKPLRLSRKIQPYVRPAITGMTCFPNPVFFLLIPFVTFPGCNLPFRFQLRCWFNDLLQNPTNPVW